MRCRTLVAGILYFHFVSCIISILQELAVRCIQRNVRAFMAVRDWPWWRLLVRVTPLLNVHRTEEQLKIATDELQTLRNKLEKIDADRNNLKTENCRLESKVRYFSSVNCDFLKRNSSQRRVRKRKNAS